MDIDYEILRLVQEHRYSIFDTTLLFFSNIGFYSLFFVIPLVYFLSSYRKKAVLRIKSFRLITTCFFIAGVVFFLKFTVERPRPFIAFPDLLVLQDASNFSFPSGHTTEAFAIAFSCIYLFPRTKLLVPVFVWALMVAYSRMILGVHYPSDIIAGVLIAFIGTLLLHKLIFIMDWFQKIEQKNLWKEKNL
ncbi:MAG: hypothetical protein CML02_21090 [Pseudooceanicola sp.]|nr:hypothetical protein [Pseudooceanicola sp.]